MNQATFKIDESSSVKQIQEKVTQEKDKIVEVVKNSAITTSNTPIKPKTPIKKVENIYYL